MNSATALYLIGFLVINTLYLTSAACTSEKAQCYAEKSAIPPRPGPTQYNDFCTLVSQYAYCVFKETCTVTYFLQNQILSEITTMSTNAKVQCTPPPSEVVQCASGLAQCFHQQQNGVATVGNDGIALCRVWQTYINCMSQQTSCHITSDVLNQQIDKLNSLLSENRVRCSVSASGTIITPAPTVFITPAPTARATRSPTAIVDCSSVISGCYEQLQSKPPRGRDVYATCRDAQDYINCMSQISSCPIASDVLNDQVDRMNTFLSQNRAGCSVSTSGTLTITRNGAAFISPSFTTLTILATMLYVVSQYFLHR